ncbi:fungal-specific transcription factor domain-containing protein [Exophiala viscosa]|uniref:Fungal-specific transcription factor domain-containing protein n=1 Tax=Exophiala viscosa TaxID=2486360 RepID=A0AAN6DZS2_9EURO|nr:fungal-specific transcription factor domain-containing protein [Exophiala viscosa]KAI1622547.1 fungal-specific transcription factor domain-containing protein [Exophiala viscosa]
MSENNFSDEDGSQLRSTIACHVCRKRKQSLQQCEYPERPLRPGPKIGSTQNPRKRKNRASDVDKEQSQQHAGQLPSPPQQSHSDTSKTGPPTSQDVSEAPESPGRRATDIQTLGFIIHPSHESCSPEKRKDDSPGSNRHSQHGSYVTSSCYALGFNPALLNHFIDKFFENFTSFQLFRPGDLRSLLHSVETSNQCKALLAAILLFATKNQDEEDDPSLQQRQHNLSSSHLVDQALKLVDQSFYECEDSPVSLPLLQAVILLTHWLLIQGVRGRAWRYLRVAVGSAYELNMHLIDANKREDDKIDPDVWCEEEERRRAWWAIWEMDVFASVIRRCPTGIDWSQNETFLPAEDENWYRGEPQKSCILRQDLVERYKFLEASGNKSSKAWFIVVNSLMKDAQKITSPIGVDKDPSPVCHSGDNQFNSSTDDSLRKPPPCKESLNRLLMIYNTLQCTTMALPRSSKYRNQYLSFGTRELDPQMALKSRLQDSAIYSIHSMAQLTKLMISKYYLFNNDLRGLSKKDPRRRTARTQALEQYSESSDEIVSLVGRSYEEQYKFVNPFIANTIWLAGAVQLLYRELAPLDKSDRDYTSSKLDLLSMTYNKFVKYWNMSTTLQKNLEVVESEIRNLQSDGRKPDSGSRARRPSAARRKSFKDPAAMAATGEVRWGQIQHEGRHEPCLKHCTILAQTDAESLIVGIGQLQNDTANGQRGPWPTVPGKANNLFRDASAQFEQMAANLFSNASAPGPNSNDVDAFLASNTTTMAQMPVMNQPMPSSNGIGTQGDLPLFASTGTEAELSPDFYVGDLSAANPDLSQYFGDILSGGYMA